LKTALRTTLKNPSTSNALWIEIFPIALIGVLAALVLFIHLGDFSLFNPDEGLYAEPAREMLDTGQYITTTLNYVVRFTKPPLVIWVMALCYKIFGVNEFGARIFCASSAFLLTIITYLFANKYLGRRVAIFSAFLLLTSPLFIGVGRMAIVDMPLSLFIAGSLFSFFHAWKQKQLSWLILGYVLVALAIMTKGPVGLLLPAIILSTFFIMLGQAKAALSFFRLPLGILIVAIIALPWFVIEIAQTQGAYFQEFIMRENFARFTTVVDAHKGPWWYHLAAVFGGLFPWSILLPQSIVTILKDISKPTSINPTNSNTARTQSSSQFALPEWLKSCQNLTDCAEVLLFAFIWSAVIIVFFSVSVSKLLPYTLPAFPALVIIIANQWQEFINSKQSKSILIYTLILGLFYIAAVFLCPVGLKYLRNAPSNLIALIIRYSILMSIALLLAFLMAMRKYLALSTIVLFGASIAAAIVFTPKFLSVISKYWEGDIPHYARFAGHAHQPLIVYKLRKPAIPFYFGNRVIQLTEKNDIAHAVKNLGQSYLITKNQYLHDLDSTGYKTIDKQNNFALVLLSK